ncbi:MAG: hypothetical protein H0W50_08955 [Parachlamydiaceae bacterium]|nr:hypothetical protein [Parachlamydiaceae bacterium]
MVHFQGESANDDARLLIQELKVGGFIYYNWSNGLTSPAQVRSLSSSLQKLAEKNENPLPLLIAVDQEGGRVVRLKEGFTILPSNLSVAESGDPSLAEKNAFTIGKELRAVGINVNLAPVVDINSNLENPVIGCRSFGATPEVAVAFAERALKGYHRAGLLTTLKHFPGHGDVKVDSHVGLPQVLKTIKELERGELYPFAKLASKTDIIMTAHLLVPALDPVQCSTLSSKTLSYLRNVIGFDEVIMTDSLVMAGVLEKCTTVEEAAIQALIAGCDILLLGGKQLIKGKRDLELAASDIQKIHGAIIHAVKVGRVPVEKLDNSVKRILLLKAPLKEEL